MLAWSVVLALALVMKLGEYRRAADPALPADIYLPHVAMRSSMIAYLPDCTPPAVPRRGSRDNRQRPQFLSIWTALLVIVQIVCLIRRMRNEEIVLMELFRDYSSYKRKTARIILGLY